MKYMCEYFADARVTVEVEAKSEKEAQQKAWKAFDGTNAVKVVWHPIGQFIKATPATEQTV